MTEYNNRSLHALLDGVCECVCVWICWGNTKTNERTMDGPMCLVLVGRVEVKREIGEGMSLDGCPLVCALFGIAGFSVLPHTNIE